jgi:acetylornithine deacetylase
MQPCLAQKGLLILRFTAAGRSAHAARAHLGLNAIVRAAEDIRLLGEYRFTREDPYLGVPTLTVTTIEGGSARNVVPDRCTFYVDVRTTPAYDHDALADELSSLVESRMEIHSKRFIPVATPHDSRIARACLDALPDAEPFGSPTASDWIFLHDVPTVKIGPGASELSHTGAEHISIEHLKSAVHDYKRIIRAYYSS